MAKKVPQQPPRIVQRYGVVKTHGDQTPVRIVIHTTEGDNAAGAFSTFASSPEGLGAQYIIDADGTIYQTMPDTKVAYGVGGNNTGTISIEIVGHANYTKAQWAQRSTQLSSVSQLIGYLGSTYKIPLKLTDPRKHGISTHAQNSKLFPQSEGHTDPGVNFPLNQVVQAARKATGVYTAVPPTGAEPAAPAAGATYPPQNNLLPQSNDPALLQRKYALQSAIADIPEPAAAGAPTAEAPLAGDFQDLGQPTLFGAQFQAQTWQKIVGDGSNVSPDTLRLAQMAQYGA